MSEMGEAPVVLWTGIIHPTTGIEMSVTVRGEEVEQTWARIAALVQAKIADGWLAVPSRDGDRVLQQRRAAKQREAKKEPGGGGVEPKTGPPAQAPLPRPTPTAPPAQAGPPPPPAVPQGAPPAPQGTPPPAQDDEGKSGTNKLNKIFVDGDGKVEFYVGKFKWPFRDSRGAEVVAGLFDDDLGWQPEHFYPGAKYDGDDVAGLKATWAKPGKYYDILRVHR